MGGEFVQAGGELVQAGGELVQGGGELMEGNSEKRGTPKSAGGDFWKTGNRHTLVCAIKAQTGKGEYIDLYQKIYRSKPKQKNDI